jgi:hypothetical protein
MTSARMLAHSPLTKVHKNSAPAKMKITVTPAREIPANGGTTKPISINIMPMMENSVSFDLPFITTSPLSFRERGHFAQFNNIIFFPAKTAGKYGELFKQFFC